MYGNPRLSLPQIMRKRKYINKQLECIKPELSQTVNLNIGVKPQLDIAVETIKSKVILGHSIDIEDRTRLAQAIASCHKIALNRIAIANAITIQPLSTLQILDTFQGRTQKSVFILHGTLMLYSRKKGASNHHLQQYQQQQSPPEPEVSQCFDSLEEFENRFQGWTQVEKYGAEELCGALSSRDSKTNAKGDHMLVGDHALVAVIGKIDQQLSYHVQEGGLSYEEKKKMLQQFSIFKTLGKKVNQFVSLFVPRKYHKNQNIYRVEDPAEKFYLILNGEVVFEQNLPGHSPSNSPSKSRLSKSIDKKQGRSTVRMVPTETLNAGNYFGEVEILGACDRNQNAQCLSVSCILLEINQEYFNKMLEYAEFREIVSKAAMSKIQQRQRKMEKAMAIHNQFNVKEPALLQETDDNINETPNQRSRRKGSNNKVKTMHGNVIRQFDTIKADQKVNFSMLEANPDMYKMTLKKFRKYNIKPPAKYVPDVSWDLKRVWKVLNLENILREDAQIVSPEGRKFYETHHRLMNQVSECKSIRPKTCSSNYRTKLEYIAYLQQFNP